MTITQILSTDDVLTRVMVLMHGWQGNAIWCDDGVLSGAFTRRIWDTGHTLTESAGLITVGVSA
jgi:hypothetical protein